MSFSRHLHGHIEFSRINIDGSLVFGVMTFENGLT
jgi:hypothetical protein